MWTKAVALVGIISVILGSWAVAYEVVRKFTGISHSVSIGWGGGGTPEKTVQFISWEAKRNRWMVAGLVLITIGSIFQAIAVCISP